MDPGFFARFFRVYWDLCGETRAPMATRIQRLADVERTGIACSLQLEKLVGSLVPGNLADFTILAASPRKVDPVRIKDILVWGAVYEGRVLPVRRASGSSGISKLGPVLVEGMLRANPEEVPDRDAAGPGAGR